MNFKNTNAETTTVTRNMDEIEAVTGNIYESCVVVSKRSDQLAVELKEELIGKLNEFNQSNSTSANGIIVQTDEDRTNSTSSNSTIVQTDEGRAPTTTTTKISSTSQIEGSNTVACS